MNLRISTSGLVKSHLTGRLAHPVLMGVDLDWGSGSIHVLRGSNGAGKTTLLKILSGLDIQDAGRIDMVIPNGEQVSATRPHILRQFGAWLPDRPGFPASLTTRQAMEEVLILDGVSRADRIQRISQAQESFALDGLLDRPGLSFSRGQQALLAFARLSLLHRDYWWLDEPFAALDVEAVKRVCAWMEAKVGQGAVVVLCTHHSDSGPLLTYNWSVSMKHWLLEGGRVREDDANNPQAGRK